MKQAYQKSSSEWLASLWLLVVVASITLTYPWWSLLFEQPPKSSEKSSNENELLMLAVAQAMLQAEETPPPIEEIPEETPIQPLEPEAITPPPVVETLVDQPVEQVVEQVIEHQPEPSIPPVIKPVEIQKPKKKTPVKTTIAQEAPVSTPTESIQPPQELVTTTEVIPPTLVHPQQSSSDVAARYRAMIVALIAQHKSYPSIARRLQEEGQVNVQFVVHRDGHLTGLNVVKKAEFERLNNAAIDIFHQLDMKLIPFFDEMPESSLSFELPIIYALQ
jgi:protein TonB